jgi:hypothetical protein
MNEESIGESVIPLGIASTGKRTLLYTVKGARGKVSFDSQTDKYASQLSNGASPEAYLSLRKMKSVFVVLEFRCDKYDSGET